MNSIHCDTSGNIFVTDLSAIRRVTPAGAVTTVFTNSGMSMLDFALASTGDIFVTDTASCQVSMISGGANLNFAFIFCCDMDYWIQARRQCSLAPPARPALRMVSGPWHPSTTRGVLC